VVGWLEWKVGGWFVSAPVGCQPGGQGKAGNSEQQVLGFTQVVIPAVGRNLFLASFNLFLINFQEIL
jgi:hypothetical protein